MAGGVYSSRQVKDIAQQEFESEVNQLLHHLRTRMKIYTGVLSSAQALFAASDSVERGEWRAFFHRQDFRSRFPGLQAFEFAQFVRAADREAFVASMRADTLLDRADFGIFPEGDRPDGAIVKYVEPLAGNEGAIGYDLAHDPVRREALERARDTGQARLTAPISLIQDPTRGSGLLLVVPIYENGAPLATVPDRQAALAGYVLAVFKADHLLQETVGPPGAFEGIDCEVYDGTTPSADRLLYDKDGGRRAAPSGDAATFTRTASMEVAGRTWSVCCRAGESFGRHAVESFVPRLVIVFGIGLAFLLSGIVVSLAISGARARVLAEQDALLMESAARSRAVMEAAVDAILTIDDQGRIETINPAGERIFGYAAAEVVGRDVSILMPSPFREDPDARITQYLGVGERSVIGLRREIVAQRKDGSMFPADFSLSEVVLPGRRMFTGSLRDITERRRVARMKDEFVSTVSHELRTPLTSILGSLGLLTGGVGGQLQPQVQALLEIAKNNCERLVHIVNDILDVEKIESGEPVFQIRTVDLATLLRQAVEAHRTSGHPIGVRLEFPDGAEGLLVRADPDRIVQVIMNLLSSAAEASPRGLAVEITAERVAEVARISVVDRGPAVPTRFLATVIQKPVPTDASSTLREGATGLGMTIAKAIVERHGGQIGVERGPGGGTRLWFALPLLHAATVPKVEPAPTRRILVCSGDPDAARGLRDLLVREGYEAEIAGSVAEARRLLLEHRFTAMTLDPLMPDEDGLAFLRELRADDRTSEMPIVVISARAEEGKDLEGVASAVVDSMSKPIDTRRILFALRHAKPRSGTRPRILHVECDADVLAVTRTVLQGEADLIPARGLWEARGLLELHPFDLVLLDVSLPDGSGLDLLPDLQREDGVSPTPVVIYSSQEVGGDSLRRVYATLVKSRVSNELLRKTILSAISGARRG